MTPSNAVSNRGRRWLIGAFAALILAGGMLWLRSGSGGASANASGGGRTSAVPVTIAPALRKDVEISLNAIGTVTPVCMVTVTSRVTGVLQEVHFSEGQLVKQNDLLAVIDPRPYQAALLQAQGQLEHDKAMLANARIDFDRYRTAYHEHAISEQQLATQAARCCGVPGSLREILQKIK